MSESITITGSSSSITDGAQFSKSDLFVHTLLNGDAIVTTTTLGEGKEEETQSSTNALSLHRHIAHAWRESAVTYRPRHIINPIEGEYISYSEPSPTLRERNMLAYSMTAMFKSAAEEEFEDGMPGDLFQGIKYFVNRHGTPAILMIDSLLKQNKDSRLIGRALRYLASIENKTTLSFRRQLIEDYLNFQTNSVRDAAALALAAIDSPASIGAVRKALAKEKSPVVSNTLRRLLTQLVETAQQTRSTSEIP